MDQMTTGEDRLDAGGFDCDSGKLKAGKILLARAACYSRKSKRQRSEMLSLSLSLR